MSRFLDVSGTVDKKQKESTPKGYAGILLGHKVKNFMTVI
jgi:hypothetical protein